MSELVVAWARCSLYMHLLQEIHSYMNQTNVRCTRLDCVKQFSFNISENAVSTKDMLLSYSHICIFKTCMSYLNQLKHIWYETSETFHRPRWGFRKGYVYVRNLIFMEVCQCVTRLFVFIRQFTICTVGERVDWAYSTWSSGECCHKMGFTNFGQSFR